MRCVLQLSLLPARSHCWERLELALQQQHETIDEWSRSCGEIESDSAQNGDCSAAVASSQLHCRADSTRSLFTVGSRQSAVSLHGDASRRAERSGMTRRHWERSADGPLPLCARRSAWHPRGALAMPISMCMRR